MVKLITQNHNRNVKNQAIKTNKTRSCQTKKTYESLEQASVSSRLLNQKGIYVKPYQCSICKKYHMTKRNKKNVLEDLFKKIEKERKNK